MGAMKGGGKLESYLEETARKLGDARQVRAGFLERSHYPDGTPVALVAVVQNYGSPARGIPPRPFFSNTIRKHSEEWPEAAAKMLRANNMDAGKALKQMGHLIAGQIRTEIIETDSPPLSPRTIVAKGFDKPLVDTGNMLNSVDSEVDE